MQIEDERSQIAKEYIDVAKLRVRDILDDAWAIARSVFGEEAKPEHAFRIVELIGSVLDSFCSNDEDEAEACESVSCSNCSHSLRHNRPS